MKHLHEIPFACKWIINKESLKKDDKNFVKSTPFIISKAEPSLEIIMSFYTDEANFKDCKVLEFFTYFSFSSNSYIRFAYHFKFLHYFGNQDIAIKNGKEPTSPLSGYGNENEYSANELFDDEGAENEKIEIECCGVVYFGSPQSFLMPLHISNANQNFSIIVGKKIIQINRSDFQSLSPVFAAMIKSGMKESIENKLYITKFSFQVVKAAINFYRGKEISQNFIKNNLYALLEFADYYLMDNLKEYLSLRSEITVKSFNEIMQIAEKFNSKNLQTRCFHFFLQSGLKAEPKKVSKMHLQKLKSFNFEFFTTFYNQKEEPGIIDYKLKNDYRSLLVVNEKEILLEKPMTADNF